jgi:hypothetical protein
VNLERQAATTKKLVSRSTSSSTTETTTNSSSYEGIVIANLHIQAVVVLNVHSLENIILDATSSNYAWWHDNIMLALMIYALADHVKSDDAFPNDPRWTKMDAIVLF